MQTLENSSEDYLKVVIDEQGKQKELSLFREKHREAVHITKAGIIGLLTEIISPLRNQS